jgi:hypothetical protein
MSSRKRRQYLKNRAPSIRTVYRKPYAYRAIEYRMQDLLEAALDAIPRTISHEHRFRTTVGQQLPVALSDLMPTGRWCFWRSDAA